MGLWAHYLSSSALTKSFRHFPIALDRTRCPMWRRNSLSLSSKLARLNSNASPFLFLRTSHSHGALARSNSTAPESTSFADPVTWSQSGPDVRCIATPPAVGLVASSSAGKAKEVADLVRHYSRCYWELSKARLRWSILFYFLRVCIFIRLFVCMIYFHMNCTVLWFIYSYELTLLLYKIFDYTVYWRGREWIRSYYIWIELYKSHSSTIIFSMLVVATSGTGYILGSGSSVDYLGLCCTCAGTMMVAAAANSLNQVWSHSNLTVSLL